MTQVELVAVSPHEREHLEAAFRDFEQHFAELLQLSQVPRPFEGDPFAMPGCEVYWLERQGQRFGFVVLDRVKLPGVKGEAGLPQAEAIQITRYGVFSGLRNRGLGSAGLPMLEEYAVEQRYPLTWSCLFINPALRFWERWVEELVCKGWRVETGPRERPPSGRTYIAWPSEATGKEDD